MKFQHGEKSCLQCQASACGARKGIRASGPSSQLLILREVQIFHPALKAEEQNLVVLTFAFAEIS